MRTDVSRRFLLVQVANPYIDTGQQVALHVGLVAHRVFIAVMALSPEGTEPDINVLWNPLLVQAAEPCTDTDQQVALHADLAAHRVCMTVMALTPELYADAVYVLSDK